MTAAHRAPSHHPGRAQRPAPGGPHDPKAPSRLEPVRVGTPDVREQDDEAGQRSRENQPLGSDPMVGDAPSG